MDEDDDSMREVREDREVRVQLAIRARGFWNDERVTALRERHVNYEDDEEIIAWAFHWGLLP